MTTIFIGGAPRSGTTLAQSILCSDATTNPMLGEPFYFRKIVFAYKQTRQDFAKRGAGFFGYPGRLARFTGEWMESFLDQVRANYPDATNLVIKEPLLTRHFVEVSALMPRARFVVMVRDPRDVVASTIEVAARMKAAGRLPRVMEPAARRDIAALAGTVNSYYRDLLGGHGHAGQRAMCYMLYEALVSEPERALDALRRFTGLALADYRPERDWNANRAGYAGVAPDDPWHSSLWGRPMTEARVGSYREVLSAEEIVAIETQCGVVFDAFAYPIDSAAA